MSCAMPTDRLCAWVHGEEDDPCAASDIARHVESCATCRAAAAEMRAIHDALRGGPSDADAPPLPLAIGEYRILRRIGAGGMGVVYEAEQAEPRRRVALKVIRGVQAADEVSRRLFAREAQALARLNHPGIATIYDADRTPEGEPYFAMELVEGVPLTEYAAGGGGRTPLGIRERLGLMKLVCDAVSYAHERGVLHRDLKPTNLLVTSSGQPKLLDFGLARIVEEEAAGKPAQTLFHGVVGTLEYMSPEQARGETVAIDLRSDVYSLGVMLYELLTGVLPYDPNVKSLPEALRAICEAAPLTPRSQGMPLPRDVETIVLKALEKQPAARYASAVALADDIRRFLTGFPIAARPASRLYRLTRLVGRHRTTTALLVLVFGALAVGATVAGVQARRIALEKQRVEAEAQNVIRLKDVLEGFWQDADPWQRGTRDARVVDVLDAAAARAENELRDVPLLAAAVRNSLGNTYRNFGTGHDLETSEALLRSALAARTRAHGDDALPTAESQNDLGETVYWRGRFEEAEAHFRQAAAVRRKHLRTPHPAIAESLNNLGTVLRDLRRPADAERYCREALAMRAELFEQLRAAGAPQRERARAAEELAETHNNLGAALRARADELRRGGDPTAAADTLRSARAAYAESLRLRIEWLGDDHPDVAKVYNNLGKALQDAGDYAAAEEHLRQALRILQSGLGGEHQLIARALYNLAVLQLQRGDASAAAETARAAHAMRRRLLGDDHVETVVTVELLRRVDAAATQPSGS